MVDRTTDVPFQKAAEALLAGESDVIANMANIAALLYHSVPTINWVGFYRVSGRELVLGPFQGKPACIRIAHGKGVCGTAWAEDRTIRVHDVEAFPGHIACDAASKSEVVVPLRRNGVVVAVLDVDSPVLGRFSDTDVTMLESIATLVERGCTW
jgi:GAF domain-containing protein